MFCPKFQIPNSKFSFHGTRKGFTLIELLIYSVIFIVAGGLVTGIVLNIKKNTALNEAQRTVDAAFNDLERRLASAIENSVAVNSATNGTLSLISATSENDNVFSLNSNSVFNREGTDSPAVITGADVKIDILNFKLTPAQNVSIDPINHWAYNDIFGWIDFGQNGNSIKIPTGVGDLTGVAWGKGSGYVFLNCLSTDNCTTSNYKVSVDTNGNLSGYAWSESMGWISFCGNPGGTNGCAASTTNYGVIINQSTGEFTGQAWSEVAGYISFNCAQGAADGTNTCSVSNSNYKVQDLRRKTTAVTADIKISYNVAPYQNIFRSGSVTFNLKQPSKVKVYSISPSSGTGIINTGITVSALPADPYFKSGAIFKLVRSGYKDIYPSTVSRTNSTTLTASSIDLTGVQAGVWDVIVINPDGQIGYLTGGFTVGTAPTTTTVPSVLSVTHGCSNEFTIDAWADYYWTAGGDGITGQPRQPDEVTGVDGLTEALAGYGFNFAIPAGSTIVGIVSNVDLYTSYPGEANSSVFTAGTLVDSNYAPYDDWQTPNESAVLISSPRTISWGSPTYNYGMTVADVNAGWFGSMFYCSISASTNQVIYATNMTMTIYYTLP